MCHVHANHSVLICPIHHIPQFTDIVQVFSLKQNWVIVWVSWYTAHSNAFCLQRKFKLTHGRKVLRFYTLQTKPALHQTKERIQFPKPSEAALKMKRWSQPNIIDALYEI